MIKKKVHANENKQKHRWKMYNKYKNDPIVKWKDSIQKVVARSKKVNKKVKKVA